MMNRCIYLFCWLCLACWLKPVSAEGKALLVIPEPGEKTLIHSDWYARKANEVKMDGNRLSAVPLDKTGWLPARVPGTVLTTLLENGLYPAPEFGLNNNLIPDIHEVGNDFYTYWFTRQFTINDLPEGRTVWLNFRGINYKAEIFLNGKRINRNTHEGMFLRKTFNITPYLRTDAPNVLAVLVYPP
ncbi:glycosyl hydrolase 2 galactose-binding domain-containing protein, partial [Parabacteroides sp.]